MACGILVPSPGMEPASPAVDVWSLNHWASREIPHVPFNSGLLESYCPSPRELLSLWKLPVSVTSWYRLCFKIIASLKSHQLFGNLNFLYDFSVYKTYIDRCILIQFSSLQFSHSVMSDSLQPHESQHARPPCPSPTPGVHSDSRRGSLNPVK